MVPASLQVFHPEAVYHQGEYVAAGRSRVPDRRQQALGLATLDTQSFFKSKRAAAFLKHAILSKYIVPFTAKAGFRSDGNRVMIVDGYAGRGRYEDGSPGSPALIAEAAQDPRLRGRCIECLFVEKREAEYRELCSMLTEIEKSSTTPITWSARRGNVADHLDELLERAAGVPLFLFLDPFGQ
jgi:three-Cys-motif partner protein